MFNNISWQTYWMTIVLVFAIYYLVVFFVYYRNDPRKIRFSKFNGSISPESTSVPYSSQPVIHEKDEDSVANACLDEVNAFFQEAQRSKWTKENLMVPVQQILSKYPYLRTSAYRTSINRLVASLSETICSLQISEEEVGHMW